MTRRVVWFSGFVGLLLLSLSPWAGAEQAGTTNLQIDTAGLAAASGTPVSGGVPFPMGAVTTPNHLRLQTAQGSEVPASYRVLAAWPDGSIKAVLISVVPTQQAEAYGPLVLAYGPSVSHSAAGLVQVIQDANSLTVATDVLKLQFSKQRFSVLEQAWTDLNSDGVFAGGEQWLSAPGDLVVIDKKTGSTFKSSLWTATDGFTLQLVESTPQKVTLLLDGRVKGVSGAVTADGDSSLLRAKIWLSVLAGSSVVQVQTTLIDTKARNSQSFTSPVMELKGVSLEWPTTLTGASFAAGGENGAVHQGAIAGQATLLQDAEATFTDRFNYSFHYNGVGSGSKAPGWMDASTGTRGLSLGIRHFWQSYPHALTIQDNGLAKIEFLPAASAANFWTVYPGVGKTHEGFLDLHGGSFTTTVKRRAALLLAPPLLKADPAWYAASAAFGPLAPPSNVTAGFEAKMAAQYNCTVLRQGCAIYAQIYGQRDFGDYQLGAGTRATGERFPEYGDGHYEDAHGMLLQFVRTGNRGWFDYAVGNARHHYDLDVMHTTNARYPWYPAGMINWHGTSEHEGYNIELGHVVPGGLDEYYLLTGDPRALDVIREQGDWIEHWARTGGGRIAPERAGDAVGLDEYERVGAWTLYTVLKSYEATGDPKYWEAASLLVKNTIDWWKMPQDHIVFDSGRPLDVSRPPQEQALYYQRSDWTQGTGYPLPTLRVANCSNSTAAYTNYAYQTHAPIAWMSALLQTTIIRYYQELERRGGLYQANIQYRDQATPVRIDLAEMREMLIQMTNMVVDHDYAGAEFKSKYPWLKELTYEHFVYSACPERDPRVSNGDQYFPWVLSFISNFDQSQVSTRWQAQWPALQAKWRKIAQTQYVKRYITESSALTGYNGVQIIWNMPYGLALMERLGLLGSLPAPLPPPSPGYGGGGGGTTTPPPAPASSTPAYRVTVNDGNPFLTVPVANLAIAAPAEAVEMNVSTSDYGQGQWQAKAAELHDMALPAGAGAKTLYIQFRNSSGTVLASLRKSLVVAPAGFTGTVPLMLSDAADTFVFSNSAGSNYAANALLNAGVYAAGYDNISLLAFPIPALAAGMTATVQGAELSLYLTENTRNTQQLLEVHEPTAAWSEDTVTWNTRPALSAAAVSLQLLFTGRSEAFRWKSFDVNPAVVQAWLQQPTQAQGLAVIGTGTPGLTSVQFVSSESFNATEDRRPRLTLMLSLSVQDSGVPIITDLQATDLTDTAARIVWTTNEPADGAVSYGTTTDYGQQGVPQTTLSTAHAITLIGLTRQTTYHAQVTSRDASGNQAVSADLVFTTTGLRMGDLNGDGALTSADVTAMAGQLIGLAPKTPAVSDMNADGQVTLGDMQILVNSLD